MKSLTMAKARALAGRHGMRVERLGFSAPTWTGEAINLDNMGVADRHTPRWPRGYSKPRDLAAGRIVHEVGHFLVAPRSQRDKPNFGLRGDNLGPPTPLPRTRVSQEEEVLATALMIAISAVLADVEWAIDFVRACNFGLWGVGRWGGDTGDGGEWAGIAELNRRGLLDGHRPTVLALGRAVLR